MPETKPITAPAPGPKLPPRRKNPTRPRMSDEEAAYTLLEIMGRMAQRVLAKAEQNPLGREASK